MISGIFTPDVNTIADAGTWISNNTAKDQSKVCLICASSATTYTVEVQEEGATGYTEIVSLDASAGLPLDWMFYVTKTPGALIKTTGTGYMRVQGILVPKV